MEKNQKILLTGVTGFVGKVVLEELLRRHQELGIEKVYVLIRKNRRGRDPEQRFLNEVSSSKCFSKLGPNWKSMVQVVGGDLTLPYLGLNEANRKHVSENVTQFINCAASIEFTLPVAEAALSNITTSLHALEFARSMINLKRMVQVSTAYVAPHLGDGLPKEEKLIELPRPAQDIYQDIVTGTVDEEELLTETGHPNTYTLTKCIAEHLLAMRKGDVPLVFLRPSIVSACWQYPFKGWIDSMAAFAGFVSLIGSGQLRVLVANKKNKLDVVPCDVVADKIIETAFFLPIRDLGHPDIRHAVAGNENNCQVEESINQIVNYFTNHPIYREPELLYIGNRNREFKLKEWYYQRRPLALTRFWLGLTGQLKKKKMVRRLAYQLKYLNSSFPYFTHNHFDFRSSIPMKALGFTPKSYTRSICAGVYKNLMKKNETEQAFAGRRYRPGTSDLQWALGQPKGNWAIRLTAYLARKAMRKAFDEVTFDRPSFKRAVEFADPKSLKIIIPTHRSYADFILCSYLFFNHPELKIAIPHIAAAEEFSKIPVLGWMFRKMNAFYIKRGVGKENEDLTRQVHDLVDRKQTLEFFIEGTRSRSRQLLYPRRGMLKCLQGTGQDCTIFPISITYDRIPEESAFIKELNGSGKPKMTLRSVLGWYLRLLRGKVKLGRIHMACGQPLPLTRETKVSELSLKINAELQKQLVVSTFHLDAFLKQHPEASFDRTWLENLIERRGGIVVNSRLKVDPDLHPVVEQTLRYEWRPFFYGDILAMFPENQALAKHVAKNSYLRVPKVQQVQDSTDPRFQELMTLLFKPICNDFVTVLEKLQGQDVMQPQELVKRVPRAHLPNLISAYEDLVAREVLRTDKEKGFVWADQSFDRDALMEAYRWKDKIRTLKAVSLSA